MRSLPSKDLGRYHRLAAIQTRIGEIKAQMKAGKISKRQGEAAIQRLVRLAAA
jgi:hypothetical protein